MVSLSVLIARRSVSALGTVLTRSAGDDWLTYESHARTILDTWSLHGGEDVFYNMPLYRYVRFSERLLLGDGDLLVFAAGLTTLYFGAVWMVARVAAGRQATIRGRWSVALAGSLVLMLTASTAIVNFVLARGSFSRSVTMQRSGRRRSPRSGSFSISSRCQTPRSASRCTVSRLRGCWQWPGPSPRGGGSTG